MRLLVLGAVGPYPERLSSFTDDGHQVWFAVTQTPPSPEQVGDVKLLDITPGSPAYNGGTTQLLLDLIERERIDAVYSLLNVWDWSGGVTAALVRRGCPVPLVRHYKEHYMTPRDDERTCIEMADGAIFINPESRSYFAGVYKLPERTACIDADLIPRRYLQGELQSKLSARDGHPHLLIAGSACDDGGRYDYRELISGLTAHGVHIHLYGQFRRMAGGGTMLFNDDVERSYREAAPAEYLHVHAPVPPSCFVEEWSRYDAGLLHIPRSDDLFRVQNIPNRYSAYIAAGLPVAVQAGEMTAMERQLDALGVGIAYTNAEHLAESLPNAVAAQRALEVREQVTFEAVYPEIVRFIESCL